MFYESRCYKQLGFILIVSIISYKKCKGFISTRGCTFSKWEATIHVRHTFTHKPAGVFFFSHTLENESRYNLFCFHVSQIPLLTVHFAEPRRILICRVIKWIKNAVCEYHLGFLHLASACLCPAVLYFFFIVSSWPCTAHYVISKQQDTAHDIFRNVK